MRRRLVLWYAILGIVCFSFSILPKQVMLAQPSSFNESLSATDWRDIQNLLPIEEQAVLQASNADNFDSFGYDIALDGDTLVVGAPYADKPGSTWTNAGAAYVFVREGTTWQEQAILQASDSLDNSLFGWSVDIDGDTIVIGRIGPVTDTLPLEAAYVFVREGTTWHEQAILRASNAQPRAFFGYSVAIDDTTIAVGALLADHSDVNISSAGAAYIFVHESESWQEQAILYAPDARTNDQFGYDLDLDGDTLVVGMPYTAQSDDGGSAYVFVRDPVAHTWANQAVLQPSVVEQDMLFGWSMSLDGDTLAVGSPAQDSMLGDDLNAGTVYLYTRENGLWSEQVVLYAEDPASEDYFGASVALEGTTLIVGAPRQDAAHIMNAGAAYVFKYAADSWQQKTILTPTQRSFEGAFGSKIVISGATVAVGNDIISSFVSRINTVYAFVLPSQTIIADAGRDFQVAAAAPVTVSGVGYQFYTSPVSYSWSITGTNPITLSNPLSVTTSFTAPSAADVLTLTLTVSNTDGLSATDDVIITVLDQAPVADAGLDQSVQSRDIVALIGRGSDPDMAGLSYEWTQSGGTPVSLTNPLSPTSMFMAPNVSDVLTFTLTVTNTQQSVATDTVEIVVTPPVGQIFLPVLYRGCRISQGC